ncbi:hypothetical protein DXT56_11835 [Salmonella enterica subsp. enterica]|nr:hypothetical protein DXT56_11835 [Salmonella enterica subsp. enterica]
MPVSRYLCIFLNVGIGETGKYDILPASRGGTGASTIAGALINFGLSDLVTAGLVQVESGTDFITAKIPFLSGGKKRFLMIPWNRRNGKIRHSASIKRRHWSVNYSRSIDKLWSE